ncbi:protein-L-isoaspartate O-methyltransferase [Lacisediminimonas sp.]|uniref:protein-L-isoaspartate O-methyltransferase family protein n=1 Tax=Lacisediminimonas sp. TaxID=3060582 RepID=UPI0027186459|nr:protein-L-isoaspartate O-methyltransferase [Lacisediminimonas sp.]MDO8298531.1 protein-L-isoaspartate O-methyltransferase [Lacisediminimonas sp.]
MKIEEARFNMIEQQIRTWNVLDTEVLAMLTIVRREEFVPAAYRSLAFADTEVPLPCGENMFPPRVEARILQEAGVRKHETVLEIGAGSGYMAALLAHRARHVTTVDIEPVLKSLAASNLASYGISNVDVVLGDGARGFGSEQFDVIVISGSLPTLPDAFLQQLKIGGRLLAFIGEAPVMEAQRTTRVSERDFQTEMLFETNVPALRNAEHRSHFRF